MSRAFPTLASGEPRRCEKAWQFYLIGLGWGSGRTRKREDKEVKLLVLILTSCSIILDLHKGDAE